MAALTSLLDRLATRIVLNHPVASAWIARRAADIAHPLPGSRPGPLSTALEAAFPEASAAELAALASAYWRSKYQRWVEHRQVETMAPDRLRDYCVSHVELRGEEHLQAALLGPEPVVAFTPHYGHFLLATLRVALEAEGKKPMFLFYNPPEKNPYSPTMRRIFDSAKTGAQSVFNDRAGILKVVRGLGRGGIMGIMPDVYDLDAGAVFVPFFGRLLIAMTGTAFFAARFGARLLPVYCARSGEDRFRLEVETPLEVSRTGSLEDDLYATTAAVAASMEARIRRAPEHWVYWESFMDRVCRGVALPTDAAGWAAQLRALRGAAPSYDGELEKLASVLQTRLGGEGTARCA